LPFGRRVLEFRFPEGEGLMQMAIALVLVLAMGPGGGKDFPYFAEVKKAYLPSGEESDAWSGAGLVLPLEDGGDFPV
jgi:hypothetical protein